MEAVPYCQDCQIRGAYAGPLMEVGHPWWRDGVLYQIYPRSFADTNGDGVGDLRGVIDAARPPRVARRRRHLARTRSMPSPNADWGYDVADYCGVDPALGTLADLDELIAEAAERGIRVLLDLVPNHSSDRHPWFQDALSRARRAHRDWYVWADPKPDGSPPNNWVRALRRLGVDARRGRRGQYYLHNFLPSSPT